MKIKLNRNILWAEIFVKTLTSAGVKYACISPGSRSTPLTYILANNPDITSFVHIDERSGAFFAGGLARKSGTPVILVCTSGTAVAEFYPGIIEAYQQRIPLIICTADRPSGSFLKGMNQTINQENIYRNHIRWFADAGLPDINKINSIKEISLRAAEEAINRSGPVHINFPFNKPFEPDAFTDEVEEDQILYIKPEYNPEPAIPVRQKDIESTAGDIIGISEGLISAGPSEYSPLFRDELIRLSRISGYPVLADGLSQIRNGSQSSQNILSNFDALFRSGYFGINKPGLLLHFGRTMTSKGYEDFILKYNGAKYLINKSGDIFDPAGKFEALIISEEIRFVKALNDFLEAKGFKRNASPWFDNIMKAESEACAVKKKIIDGAEFPDEGRIISEIINLLPESCNLMLSNSLPVRDFDHFTDQNISRIRTYHNRGASGIDGIISTALGIAAEGEKTILITGDLAFYHDMNGLLASSHYNIPLLIILINNNGGGIFETLPVSSYKDLFRKYFITPHNLDFKYFVQGYGGYYKNIGGWEDLKLSFAESLERKVFSVLEIKTDAESSLKTRRKYWKETKDRLHDNSLI